MADPILEVRGVSKSFRVAGNGRGTGILCALDGINLTLGRSESVALVGESGCGKSTLARTLLMLERPDEGTVRFHGVDPFTLKGKELLSWRRRVQMVFQDPYASLNSRMTAGEIISEPWATHRDLYPSKQERKDRLGELLELVGLHARDASRSPGEFSGGQRQRIGIARALALNPELMVLDEPVSALDLSVQAQVLNLLNDLQQRLGVSYLFVSHDLSVVRHVADRVAVMYLGRIVESGSTADVFDRPRHPYTAALMSASPRLDPSGERGRRIILEGELPSPLDPPSGCRFRTRCWRADDTCATVEPTPREAQDGSGQVFECHHPLEATPGGRGSLAPTTT